MSPYIRFCSRQLNAAALIQRRHENVPEFRELLKRCQSHAKIKGMPLTSYLIKPMQRITKYPLLIKKVNSIIVIYSTLAKFMKNFLLPIEIVLKTEN